MFETKQSQVKQLPPSTIHKEMETSAAGNESRLPNLPNNRSSDKLRIKAYVEPYADTNNESIDKGPTALVHGVIDALHIASDLRRALELNVMQSVSSGVGGKKAEGRKAFYALKDNSDPENKRYGVFDVKGDLVTHATAPPSPLEEPGTIPPRKSDPSSITDRGTSRLLPNSDYWSTQEAIVNCQADLTSVPLQKLIEPLITQNVLLTQQLQTGQRQPSPATCANLSDTVRPKHEREVQQYSRYDLCDPTKLRLEKWRKIPEICRWEDFRQSLRNKSSQWHKDDATRDGNFDHEDIRSPRVNDNFWRDVERKLHGIRAKREDNSFGTPRGEYEWPDRPLPRNAIRPSGRNKEVRQAIFPPGHPWGGSGFGFRRHRRSPYKSLGELAAYYANLEPATQGDTLSLLLACRRLEKQIEQQHAMIDMLDHDLAQAQQTLKTPPEWNQVIATGLRTPTANLRDERGSAVADDSKVSDAPLYLRGRVLLQGKDPVPGFPYKTSRDMAAAVREARAVLDNNAVSGLKGIGSTLQRDPKGAIPGSETALDKREMKEAGAHLVQKTETQRNNTSVTSHQKRPGLSPQTALKKVTFASEAKVSPPSPASPLKKLNNDSAMSTVGTAKIVSIPTPPSPLSVKPPPPMKKLPVGVKRPIFSMKN